MEEEEEDAARPWSVLPLLARHSSTALYAPPSAALSPLPPSPPAPSPSCGGSASGGCPPRGGAVVAGSPVKDADGEERKRSEPERSKLPFEVFAGRMGDSLVARSADAPPRAALSGERDAEADSRSCILRRALHAARLLDGVPPAASADFVNGEDSRGVRGFNVP